MTLTPEELKTVREALEESMVWVPCDNDNSNACMIRDALTIIAKQEAVEPQPEAMRGAEEWPCRQQTGSADGISGYCLKCGAIEGEACRNAIASTVRKG